MWTTYSGHLYMAEKQLEEDIKWWMGKNPPETEEERKQREIENKLGGELPW